MISLEDCIALCGLSEAEVAAVAEHEHLPEVAAAVLGQYLLHQKHGADRIREMIVDDMRAALKAGDTSHAGELLAALRHFLATHVGELPAAVKQRASGGGTMA
jgi:hypothetical protein